MTARLAACAIYRDEADYLAEWIEFHRLCGFELFFLYDKSPRQQRTRRLVDGAADLFAAGIKLAKLPVFGGLRRKIVALLADAGLVPSSDDFARSASSESAPTFALETS